MPLELLPNTQHLPARSSTRPPAILHTMSRQPFDVYADLPCTTDTPVDDAHAVDRQLEQSKHKVNELEEQLAQLRNQARVWAKQRAVLLHNMSTLLQTAQVEMNRKDKEIGKLRQEVQQLRKMIRYD